MEVFPLGSEGIHPSKPSRIDQDVFGPFSMFLLIWLLNFHQKKNQHRHDGHCHFMNGDQASYQTLKNVKESE